MRKDIDPLPPIIMINVNDVDYEKSIDDKDLQSTGDDSIDRLLGLDNMNEEGKSGEIEAWANVYQDLVGDTVSNEGNINRLIREIEVEGETWKGSRKRKETKKLAAYNQDEGLKQKPLLTQGIHVREVSEKGKVPKCHYCHGSIENRGEWHTVKVTKTTADQRWGRNEHHFHFKCAKGGLEENDRAVNQLLAIVRSKNTIGHVLKMVTEYRDYSGEY